MAAATLDQAAVDKRAREIETEYLSSLADLNVNSKPLINMLTILAEENLDYAPIIVNAVEKHLSQVQPEVKLPILYLIDSIVKNVGKQYQSLFSQVIVSTFCGVFETVNERVREKMFSLRQTWNEVFPQSKLYALDIKINSIDPGWPITAQLKPKSPAIHVNPIFLKNKVPEPNMDMQQQLRDKQRELLELQARKLELELIATKKRIEEQEKQLVLQTASVSKESPELKRPASAIVQPNATVPNPRGRILPPNPGMINLAKSRDPRLARRNAALAASSSATAGVSSTVVAGVQIPAQPDKERLGRIPKRVDPRLKAQQVDADRKKVTSTTTSSSSVSSQKSRTAEYDPTKKRDRKDDAGRPSKSSSLKSSSSEKKKSSSELSPSKSSPSSKKKSSSADKSPSRSEKSSPKSRESSSSSKYGKISSSSSSESIKSATRRPRESSKSPNRTASPATTGGDSLPMPIANESKDVDLRMLMPEKKLKLDQQQQQQAKLVMKPVADQKKVLGESAAITAAAAIVDPQKLENVGIVAGMPMKDVDLRIPPPAAAALMKDVVVVAVPDSVSPGMVVGGPSSTMEPTAETLPASSAGMVVEPASSTTTVDSLAQGGTIKKRPSNHKYEEPASKKTKSEKIDVLFGAEDVDLRKLAGPMNPVEVLPPPPPIISAESTIPVESTIGSPERQTSKAALEAVRAKIAEATKNKDRDKLGRPLLYNKLPDDPAERRRSINQPKPMDVDLRQQQQLQQQDMSIDDNSQDGMNANIKTIIAQAQEQMEKGEITPEQYNILMKQVIQLNETQKIRQAQRMELLKRSQQQQQQPVEPDEPIRIDDDKTRSPLPVEESPVVPPAAAPVNDFRGKVAPLEAKSKFDGPTFANATAADLRQRDPRRPRDVRFNPQPPVQAAQGWANRPVQSVPAPSGLIINHRPPAPLLNPWEKAPFPRIDQNLIPPPPIRPHYPPPIVGMNNVAGPMQTMLTPGVAKLNDSVRTINIDGIQREIRFYDDIAVIFMSWDEPKEIGFQKGSRMVVVDDRDSFELSFNECYKAITIEGKVYQMKLGAPTRELYIDNSWYECYFGDPPSNITLDGITRVFKISGPAPQVKIGNSRNDLVAGKINMIVNAETIIPVFLDSQIQMFEIQGSIHKLQFADFLLTVILDDHPYPVEFGGLPKVFKLRGKDYYIRFTAIPKLVVPGRVYIRDMIRTPLHRDLRTPPRDQSMLPTFMPQLNNVMPSMPQNNLFPAMQPQAPLIVPPIVTGLDYLTNLMPHSMPAANVSNNLTGYQIQSEDRPAVAPVVPAAPIATPVATTTSAIPILQNINIDELYKKIVAAGILTKANSAPASTSTSASSVASKLDKALEEELEEIEPVFLHKPDQIKKRQSAIVSQLFCGMQCSSCGVRFPPEQTMKYSQHLDWHFRQNRRDRDSARKAHSRKWYYDVSDWIQYEEIEDLEEREKNWFETQQTEQTEFNGDGETGGRNVDSPLPSCPAGSDEADKRCHMCHDEFEQFYCEDTEEWHLRNAIRVEENTYHPVCYEDYKASLTLDETAMNATAETDQSKVDEDVEEVKIKQEVISDPDDTAKEITMEEDDDVIVLPPSEEVVTEIPDDDDIETLDSHSTADDGRTQSAAGGEDAASKSTPQEPQIIETRIDDDIAIQEPTIENITVNDLDESEEFRNGVVPDESSQTSQPIKVKEEPKDEDEIDEEDAQFEDVGTLESSVMVEDVFKDTDTVDVEAVPSPAPALESTSQSQLKPSIDGNVELQDAPATTGIITNRIKINITKAKTTNTSGSSTAATANSTTASSSSVGSHGGGSSIAVLVSGGGGGGNSYADNDDLLYANLDDVHGGENSQNSSNQLIMMMHEEELEESNKATEEEPTDLAYDLKPSLHGIEFIRQPRVENGLEQSGLCSIM